MEGKRDATGSLAGKQSTGTIPGSCSDVVPAITYTIADQPVSLLLLHGCASLDHVRFVDLMPISVLLVDNIDHARLGIFVFCRPRIGEKASKMTVYAL